MSSIVTINVGGTIFQTREENIGQSEYLTSLLSGRWGEEAFIDEDAHIFKHVMGYLRDPTYDFPEKYLYKLDYYGITYEPLSRTPQYISGNTLVRTISPSNKKDYLRRIEMLNSGDKVETTNGEYAKIVSMNQINQVRVGSLATRDGITLTRRNLIPGDLRYRQEPLGGPHETKNKLYILTLEGSKYLQLYNSRGEPAFIATVASH